MKTKNMKPFLKTILYAGLFSLLLPTLQIAQAGLAIDPGVTTGMLDKIDEIQDENLRDMLRASVWPGFGERYMNLERPEEDLTPFEKNYKSQPLTWEEKLDNVNFILNEAEDLTTLTPENLEYKDIVFGEAIIPVPDKRVVEILNTQYFADEAERLAAEKQQLMADFYEKGGTGQSIQAIEDQYAQKLAILVQAENEFKAAKIDFLKIENQKTYNRIDEETFNTQTREIVAKFEDFFSLGNRNALFSDDEIKAIGTQIYDKSETRSLAAGQQNNAHTPTTISSKIYYWGISIALMLMAVGLGFLAFRKLHKN